jgi:hypothetical protein
VYRLLPELLPGTESKFAQYFVRDCLQVDSTGHYSLDAFVAAWNEQVQNRVGEGVAAALDDGKKTNNIELHCSIL